MRRYSASIALACAFAVTAYAAEQAPAEAFEAVPPPQVVLQQPDLDKQTPAEEQPAAPATPPQTTSGMSPEDWQKVQEEIDKGRDAGGQTAAPTATDTTPAQGPSTGMSFLRGIVALCVVLALILVCYYLVNRYGQKSPLFAGSTLGKILGRVHLSPKAELYFVKVKDRVLVVGVTQNGISRVAEFDADMFEDLQPGAAPIGQPAPQQLSFANELRSQTKPEPTPSAVSEELAALRAELDKARQFFRETTGEPGAL